MAVGIGHDNTIPSDRSQCIRVHHLFPRHCFENYGGQSLRSRFDKRSLSHLSPQLKSHDTLIVVTDLYRTMKLITAFYLALTFSYIAFAAKPVHWIVTWGASPAPQLSDEEQ